MQKIAQITLVIKDYEEAIAFYCTKLGFHLVEDTPLSNTKRWVVVQPDAPYSCAILLAKAVNPDQEAAIGHQTGGRVFLFLHTSDFENFHQQLIHHKVQIVREPVVEPYGKVLVFADLYRYDKQFRPISAVPHCSVCLYASAFNQN